MSIQSSLTQFEFDLAWSFHGDAWLDRGVIDIGSQRQLALRVLVCGQPVAQAFAEVRSYPDAPKTIEEAAEVCEHVHDSFFKGTLL